MSAVPGELTALTLAEAAGLIAARELSPVELTRAHLDRIEAIEPRLNSFITLLAEDALAEAREAEDAIGRGNYRGALHGVPIALKDLYETKGVRTTAGSSFLADHVPDADGAVVEKLRGAGAVILGKLNLHEWALGVTTDNPHFGACKNPWDLERSPGGSSGGSGAALSAGLCLGSYGSDTGGSIRIPAALCGVVGLKPTYGRVSLRGVVPLSWNLDHAGPMARRVRDAAVLLATVAGYDPNDAYSGDVPVDDYLADLAAGVAGWRVALAGGDYFAGADAEVLEAVRAAARVFEELGAHVVEVELERMQEAARANGVMTISDAAAFHRERLERAPEGFGADVLARLRRGAAYASGEYVQARRTQSLLRRSFQRWFDDCHVLLTPTVPSAAPVLAGLDAVEVAPLLTRFTGPFNLTGLPALSLPCGFTQGGLPIGLQIVGPPWAEARVLRAGHAYEQATSWHTRAPSLQ
jgi:aspartyl-tRNA(Asn)/glutamyl-tRNA(Gln) amidotransferase subunit A